MKDEEGKCHATVEAFSVVEKSIQDLKNKLLEEERERKSATSALDNAERQAESQRVLGRNVEDQLSASKAQITTLKKKLEETKKARDDAERAREEAERAREQAKQDRYDIGVAEIEVALRAEVSRVYRNCCS